MTAVACTRPPDEPRVHSERIGSIGSGYRRNSLVVSRDHRRFAWVKQVGDACWVVVDGRKGPRFARCTNPLFSPDGETVAYWATETVEDPPRAHLVINGEPQPAVVSDQGAIAFSRTGGGWASIAPVRVEPKPAQDASAGDESAKPQDDDAKPQSDDAATQQNDAAATSRRLVVESSLGNLGEYRDTSNPAVSPDGKHVAFVALDDDGQQVLIVDGKQVRAFGMPQTSFLPAIKQTKSGPGLEPEATVRYLPDGSLVGVALGENGWTVFHGERTLAEYAGLRLPPKAGFEVTQSELRSAPAILAGSLVVAEEAPVACWWERLEGEADRWRVVCNGAPIDAQVCDAPSSEHPIQVAPDGKSAMYVCTRAVDAPPDADPSETRELWVVLPDRQIGPHRFVWALERLPDGSHFAYAAADSLTDPWYYVVDGKRVDGPWQHVFPPKISPDGSIVVWGASQDPDGKRVDLVRNGRVLTRAQVVMSPPRFGPDGSVQWVVRRGNSLRRVIFD
ncbi:MAG TPA: hypothetical protein VIS07_03490 [Candidatus Binatia bacterium]